MAFGDRFKNWVSSWGDDDTVYEDESSFDDDIWADLGIDPGSDPDTWTDPITPTEDPYGIGSLFDFDPASNIFDPDPTPNIFGDEDWADTYDFGLPKSPTVDFEDPDFNWGEFDVDSYLDSILNPDPNYGWDTDPETGMSFNTGYFDDPDWLSKGWDDEEFNNFLREFDFDDPKADENWAGGINSLRGWETDPETGMSMNVGSILGDTTSGFQTPRDYLDYLNKDWSTVGGAGAGTTGTTPAASGIFSGKRMPKLAGFLNRILGGANTAIDTVGGGIGGLLNSTLGQLAMLNYMKNKNKDIMDIPVGWGDGGGGGGGDGSPIDYRVFNLQPALMPGVAYANVAPPVPPPEMRGGGLGDVTLAKLEPGEFVVTKKAVDNIGAQNLYRMMKQAEGRG
jgi:hypothetical protein